MVAAAAGVRSSLAAGVGAGGEAATTRLGAHHDTAVRAAAAAMTSDRVTVRGIKARMVSHEPPRPVPG